MTLQCAITGKKPGRGYAYARRGKAKYLGGVGRKVTGISRRTFKPNLQRIQIDINGQVCRKRVCVQCIRGGRVKRPQRAKLFQMPKI